MPAVPILARAISLVHAQAASETCLAPFSSMDIWSPALPAARAGTGTSVVSQS